MYVHDLKKISSKDLVSKGAIWCDQIDQLVKSVSVIITCLPSPKSVNDVILQSITNINDRHLWIEMSTTDEEKMISLSNLFLKKNAEVIEAPMTGGQHRAQSGNISILVGGKRESFERSFPILSCLGFNILHCGDIGKASTLKVVTNYLASINLLAIGEALMVCKKYDIDLGIAFKGIKISSGNSFVNETETQVILNGSYDVGFTMDLVCKDIGLFEKLVNKYKIPNALSKLMTKIFTKGKLKYGPRATSTSIVKLIEEECSVQLRAKGFPAILKDKEIKKNGIEII